MYCLAAGLSFLTAFLLLNRSNILRLRFFSRLRPPFLQKKRLPERGQADLHHVSCIESQYELNARKRSLFPAPPGFVGRRPVYGFIRSYPDLPKARTTTSTVTITARAPLSMLGVEMNGGTIIDSVMAFSLIRLDRTGYCIVDADLRNVLG